MKKNEEERWEKNGWVEGELDVAYWDTFWQNFDIGPKVSKEMICGFWIQKKKKNIAFW